MRVEIHDSFRGNVSIPATRVVIYDSYDNPIAFIVNVEGEHYYISTAADKGFNRNLKNMGIDKTVIVDHLDTTKLKRLE